ncbi:MAG: GNAT family N-acetyltransferase [Paludibacteraceae bacterium]|nr:GNAT family N-acetyltransferase [Paludibacteraceae bacterium]
MKDIIAPISATLIKEELIIERLLRKTNKANNEIYVVNAHNAPNTMLEIGRLRELSFRTAGGGSGKEIDTDEFDYLDIPYEQLIVWNPEADEIIGGYRFFQGKNAVIKPNGQPQMAIEHLFDFSPEFIDNYLPYTMEMARAFVQPKYQSSQMGVKSLFALDNLWDGIGALIALIDDVKYLLGKVTIYPQMKAEARYAIIYFMSKFFGNESNMIVPKTPLFVPEKLQKELDGYFTEVDPKDNFRLLNTYVKEQKETIPPLIHAYIKLSSSMQTYGTAQDPDFGNIYDTGMIITIDDIYDAKRDRYVETFIQSRLEENRKLF